MSEEVRTTSATGGQKGTKMERTDLLPPKALLEIAEHYGRGAGKYDDNQWRKGYEWSKSYAALMRHLMQWWGGEDNDPELGSSHLAAAGWHILTLLTFKDDYPEYDDRYKPPAKWKSEDTERMVSAYKGYPERPKKRSVVITLPAEFAKGMLEEADALRKSWDDLYYDVTHPRSGSVGSLGGVVSYNTDSFDSPYSVPAIKYATDEDGKLYVIPNE